MREWQLKFPEKRLAQRVRFYGLTLAEYKELETRQNGLCAVCGSPPIWRKRLDIDHDHKTGIVRGLLCNRCNLGLGRFEDDPALFRKVATYLERIV